MSCLLRFYNDFSLESEACRLFVDLPLPEPVKTYCQSGPLETVFSVIWILKVHWFPLKKSQIQSDGNLPQASVCQVFILWTPSESLFSIAELRGEYSCISKHHIRPMCHKTWWRHQMEPFSALLAICAGNSPVPGEFPAQRPVTRSFDVLFDLRLIKRLPKQSWGWWLRRHRAHYDVIAMISKPFCNSLFCCSYIIRHVCIHEVYLPVSFRVNNDGTLEIS